ncbi:putative acetyltransferase [Neochlamydia sp. EPS4]|uniref:GNAT family N-acetyltransferase n=1 Tax=Neochlamydia sp. EPS4 TaxID=1478175 RepID=UPI0005833343|nr:GNAT family protein [Neochlamydia sp. EPS4]KIC75406.1 putative acetyltransferase [Neochlamydia sp. EPS4]
MTEKKNSPEGIELRYSDLSDGKYLKQWLLDPSVARWFPMFDEVEIDDAVARWIGFSRYKCSLTATKEGVPCGITTLYLQPYRKLAHQCEFGIIVAPEMRGQGVGTLLISNLSHMAKENFKIEVLHLQVYAENPAINLYTRMGFREFGRQTHWIKEKDGFYVGRVFMERWL